MSLDVSERLFSIASILTDPICVAHERYALVTLPKNNTIYPQTSQMNTLHYGAYLASNAAQAAFLFIVGIPLATIGSVIRFTAIQISKHNFTYVKGEEQLEKAFQWPFTLLKWNICGIGGGFPVVQNGLKLWKDRLDTIVQKVIDAEADMIFLEEVYDYQLGKQLISKLREFYPHFYFNTGPKITGAPMGLLVASKFKIDDPEFSYYPTSTNLGRIKFVGKGIFSCKVGGEVFFLHSHLQHSEEKSSKTRKDAERAARESQVNQIKEKLPNLDNGERTVFLGDLNMELQEMHNLKIFDVFKQPESNQPTYFPIDTLARPQSKPKDELLKSIDYCLIDQDHGRAPRQTQVEVVQAFDLHDPKKNDSDHHALKVTLS